jgi:hypothetical protein
MSTTRDFQVFLVRYVGNPPQSRFVGLAVCMSEISEGGSRFLACECTDKWEELEAQFPDADVDFLKDWCEAVQKEFCCPDTNRSVQQRLEDCSSHIDVSVTRRTFETTVDAGEEMKKLVQEYLR